MFQSDQLYRLIAASAPSAKLTVSFSPRVEVLLVGVQLDASQVRQSVWLP